MKFFEWAADMLFGDLIGRIPVIDSEPDII